MKNWNQLKSTNDVSKEQQIKVLIETKFCSILNSIQQFLQQHRENIRLLCYTWLYYDAYINLIN